MDGWLWVVLIIVIILILIICIYVAKLILNNPTGPKEHKAYNSIITHKSLGKRGQTGNQFFQLACLIGISERNGSKIVIPTSIQKLPIAKIIDLDNFHIEDIKTTHKYRELENYENIYIPDNRVYDIRGYRQDYRYFIHCEHKVKELLEPKDELVEKVKPFIPDKPYCVIHIRKGYDKIWTNFLHITTSLYTLPDQYYIGAVETIRNLYGDIDIYICTDDRKKCESLRQTIGAEFSPNMDGVPGDVADFMFMYFSEYLVISNSTFSWWPAYLRTREITICPKEWWYELGLPNKLADLSSWLLYYYDWVIIDNNGSKSRDRISKDQVNNDTTNNVLTAVKTIRGIIV